MLFPPPWFFPLDPLFRGAPFERYSTRGENPSRGKQHGLLSVLCRPPSAVCTSRNKFGKRKRRKVKRNHAAALESTPWAFGPDPGASPLVGLRTAPLQGTRPQPSKEDFFILAVSAAAVEKRRARIAHKPRSRSDLSVDTWETGPPSNDP